MKVNAVILNYNDADTVETLVRSICGYEVLEYIILVDNHSQDDSRQKLQQLACEHEKIQLVFCRRTLAADPLALSSGRMGASAQRNIPSGVCV